MTPIPDFRFELIDSNDKHVLTVSYLRSTSSLKKMADFIQDIFDEYPYVMKVIMEEPIKLGHSEVGSRPNAVFIRLHERQNGYSYYDVHSKEPGYHDVYDPQYDNPKVAKAIDKELKEGGFKVNDTGPVKPVSTMPIDDLGAKTMMQNIKDFAPPGGHPQKPQNGKTASDRYKPGPGMGPKKQPFQQEFDNFMMNCEKSHDAFIEIHATSLYKMVKRETNNYNQSIELLGKIASSHDPETIQGQIIHKTEIMLEDEIEAMYHKLLSQEYEPF